jgi:hypothetical protein
MKRSLLANLSLKGASHVVMVSHPAEVAWVIHEAVQSTAVSSVPRP